MAAGEAFTMKSMKRMKGEARSSDGPHAKHGSLPQ